MPIPISDIRSRAQSFVTSWTGASHEAAEKQSFWNDFFYVFGIERRRVASFEAPVKTLSASSKFIDLLWKGNLLVEHKSLGHSLDKAYQQAMDYLPGLKDYELPKYVLVSDFARFRLYNLDSGTQTDFELKDLPKKISLFGFISGYVVREFKDEDPVNIRAAELMGKLYDALEETGYSDHPLKIFLVRTLFCLFAEDTGIFDRHQLTDFIETMTRPDGSDTGTQLSYLFQVLNTPSEKRPASLDAVISAFPYVNGALFAETLQIPSFSEKMRETLLRCCYFDWSQISPAIFGSMFQSVMDKTVRRNLGAHYTSEKNILKVVRSLFLDDLVAEFKRIRSSRPLLDDFHNRLSRMKFLDPACGCGNFLIISYRELRLLELEILKILHERDQQTGQLTHTTLISKLDVDAMIGIEVDEFAGRIAEVALWLMDHQMNQILSETFGETFIRLPLKKGAKITIGNALQLNWETLVSKTDLTFILGNPPFIGKHLRNEQQNKDMDLVFSGIKGAGLLDYVSCWYLKAADFVKETTISVAFVSTNSITQGEQVGILWTELFKRNMKIRFAHRTFRWSNEARGKAAVHVVIIGFYWQDPEFKGVSEPIKYLFDYEDIKGEPHVSRAKNINPYLADFDDLIIKSRNTPICDVPRMFYGNKPVDGGNLILEESELANFIGKEPAANAFIRPLISAKEFLNGKNRWCLWLNEVSPSELRKMPAVMARIQKVKEMREASVDEGARKLASIPWRFRDINNPQSFLVVPLHSSENRTNIPIGYFNQGEIVHNSCSFIPEATLYHFGVISSAMHMVWIATVCGRLESRFRYSSDIVYNNFPWPLKPTDLQIKSVEQKAAHLLSVREKYKGDSLADLYDPLTMPQDLTKAHQELDLAVDKCYRTQSFPSAVTRLEFLFDLYKQIVAAGQMSLPGMEKVKKTRKKKG